VPQYATRHDEMVAVAREMETVRARQFIGRKRMGEFLHDGGRLGQRGAPNMDLATGQRGFAR
jgi:hypothetical protein